MRFTLPELPYEQSALEPHISKETVHYHYDKHHAGYLDKLEQALTQDARREFELEEILRDAYQREEAEVFNPAAQVYNHNLYWESLSPDSTQEPCREVRQLLDRDFGSLDEFKQEFRDRAAAQFGSGWTWLVFDSSANRLRVVSTANAMTPVAVGLEPMITLDVWEHAYYLDFQHRRADYIETFLDKLINWQRVSSRFDELPVAA